MTKLSMTFYAIIIIIRATKQMENCPNDNDGKCHWKLNPIEETWTAFYSAGNLWIIFGLHSLRKSEIIYLKVYSQHNLWNILEHVKNSGYSQHPSLRTAFEMMQLPDILEFGKITFFRYPSTWWGLRCVCVGHLRSPEKLFIDKVSEKRMRYLRGIEGF